MADFCPHCSRYADPEDEIVSLKFTMQGMREISDMTIAELHYKLKERDAQIEQLKSAMTGDELLDAYRSCNQEVTHLRALVKKLEASAKADDQRTRDAPASGLNPVSKDGSMEGRGVDPTLRGATSPTLSKNTT